MTDLQQEAEQIEKDYKQFRELLSGLGERSINIVKMLDQLEDRIIECPASSKDSFHLAKMGGWLNHSLRVLNFLIKLIKTFDEKFDKDSIIISGLFHDVNKLGSPDAPYYLPETEIWRLKKGYKYKINEKIPFFSGAQGGLFLLQHFNITLKSDEYLSILLNDGCALEPNRTYSFREPKLATLVHMADRYSCLKEKEFNL